MRHAKLAARAALSTVAVLAGLALAAPPAPASGVTVPPFTRSVLPNGTVLVVMPRKDVPLIAVTAIVRGGSVTDPETVFVSRPPNAVATNCARAVKDRAVRFVTSTA